MNGRLKTAIAGSERPGNEKEYHYLSRAPWPPDPFKQRSLADILSEVYNDQQQ